MYLLKLAPTQAVTLLGHSAGQTSQVGEVRTPERQVCDAGCFHSHCLIQLWGLRRPRAWVSLGVWQLYELFPLAYSHWSQTHCLRAPEVSSASSQEQPSEHLMKGASSFRWLPNALSLTAAGFLHETKLCACRGCMEERALSFPHRRYTSMPLGKFKDALWRHGGGWHLSQLHIIPELA